MLRAGFIILHYARLPVLFITKTVQKVSSHWCECGCVCVCLCDVCLVCVCVCLVCVCVCGCVCVCVCVREREREREVGGREGECVSE